MCSHLVARTNGENIHTLVSGGVFIASLISLSNNEFLQFLSFCFLMQPLDIRLKQFTENLLMTCIRLYKKVQFRNVWKEVSLRTKHF